MTPDKIEQLKEEIERLEEEYQKAQEQSMFDKKKADQAYKRLKRKIKDLKALEEEQG